MELLKEKKLQLNGKEVRILAGNPQIKVSWDDLKPFFKKMAKVMEENA